MYFNSRRNHRHDKNRGGRVAIMEALEPRTYLTTYTWLGGTMDGNGFVDLSEGANWRHGGVAGAPTSADDVVFDDSGDYGALIRVDDAITFTNMFVVTDDLVLNLAGHTLTLSGDLSIANEEAEHGTLRVVNTGNTGVLSAANIYMAGGSGSSANLYLFGSNAGVVSSGVLDICQGSGSSGLVTMSKVEGATTGPQSKGGYLEVLGGTDSLWGQLYHTDLTVGVLDGGSLFTRGIQLTGDPGAMYHTIETSTSTIIIGAKSFWSSKGDISRYGATWIAAGGALLGVGHIDGSIPVQPGGGAITPGGGIDFMVDNDGWQAMLAPDPEDVCGTLTVDGSLDISNTRFFFALATPIGGLGTATRATLSSEETFGDLIPSSQLVVTGTLTLGVDLSSVFNGLFIGTGGTLTNSPYWKVMQAGDISGSFRVFDINEGEVDYTWGDALPSCASHGLPELAAGNAWALDCAWNEEESAYDIVLRIVEVDVPDPIYIIPGDSFATDASDNVYQNLYAINLLGHKTLSTPNLGDDLDFSAGSYITIFYLGESAGQNSSLTVLPNFYAGGELWVADDGHGSRSAGDSWTLIRAGTIAGGDFAGVVWGMPITDTGVLSHFPSLSGPLAWELTVKTVSASEQDVVLTVVPYNGTIAIDQGDITEINVGGDSEGDPFGAILIARDLTMDFSLNVNADTLGNCGTLVVLGDFTIPSNYSSFSLNITQIDGCENGSPGLGTVYVPVVASSLDGLYYLSYAANSLPGLASGLTWQISTASVSIYADGYFTLDPGGASGHGDPISGTAITLTVVEE